MLHKDEIQNIADEVVNELRSDFEEKIYQEAPLEQGSGLKGTNTTASASFPFFYKGQQVGVVRADVVVRKNSEEVVLDLKANGHDAVKQRTKNELEAYLRALRNRSHERQESGELVLWWSSRALGI